MNYSNVFNATKRQFDNTIKREGITVADYYDADKTYEVFFRRNNRGTTPQGKVRFYYAQSTPIQIGTIFVLGEEPYLVISQDGVESDIYYTSLAVRCDTSFNVTTGNGYVAVPCAVISDKYTLSHNSTISMISGSVTVYTGDNAYARQIAINGTYTNFGGYYDVGNVFYNDGLAYIYMKRGVAPETDTYRLTYNGVTSLDMADATTYQLTYTAMKNDTVVTSPTLTYVSSDDTIATVSDTGLLTLLAFGNVTITATWAAGGVTATAIITVSNAGDSPEPGVGTVTISGRDTIKIGFYRAYTAVYTDSAGNDVSSNYTSSWTITNCTFDESKITSEVTEANKIKLTIADDESLAGGTFTLNVVDTEGKYSPASFSVTVEPLV